jgi:cation diffusion facilitator CzcD-associated flavoprotein CzcO
MYRQCIIGAGISGILLILLLIQTHHIPPDSIVIIDPHFDGGALTRSWAPVTSNTPWSVTYKALKRYLSSYEFPEWATTLPMDQPTPVSKISALVMDLIKPHLKSIKCIKGYVSQVSWANNTWSVTVGPTTIGSQKIHFTFGSSPKSLDLPTPSIPLEIALDSRRLQDYIQPNQKVLVFGTAHSGTLIIRNLTNLGAQVTAVYSGSTPFKWARDGEYDGVKLEAAEIADDIVHLKYPSVKLLPLGEFILTEADWVVYAIGFEQDNRLVVLVDGQQTTYSKYNGWTGKLADVPNAWGFGIAYPSLAPDAVHRDVGISSFVEHINRQLTSIL